MKTKTLIICTIVVLAALTIWLLYNQNKPEPESDLELPLQESTFSGNEDVAITEPEGSGLLSILKDNSPGLHAHFPVE